MNQAANSRRVLETLEHIRKPPPASISRSEWIKQTAEATRKSRGLTGRSGAHGQLLGHYIERLDNATYGARNLFRGRTLVARAKHVNEAYDASRFIRGKFAGGVQQKAGPAGVRSAISKIERLKPGSASRATIRVPSDQVSAAKTAASRRARVQGMAFTRADAVESMDAGLAQLAEKGARVTSRTRALAKGGAISAGINCAIGAVTDIGALRRGELNRRDFAANRGVDATEGASTAVAGSLAAGAASTLTTAALGTSTGTTIGAVAVGGVTVAGAAPVVAGLAASLAVGIGVSRGFSVARAALEKRRRGPTGADASPDPRDPRNPIAAEPVPETLGRG